MKKYLPFWTLLISGMLFFVSCSDDNDGPNGGNGTVPQAVLDAFQSQYGQTRAEWSVKDGYAVAEFTGESGETTAWYALDDARWGMTETEIPYSALPQAIQSAIEESAYVDWTPDHEVDVLDRNGSEMLYVIEMKNGGVEVDLYYTEEGILVNEYVDSDGKGNDYSNYLPQTPVASASDWIEQNFPGARIVDVDVERNGTEIEIIQNGMKHEIWFDSSSAWVSTKTEYERYNIPEIVRTFVETNYSNYHIDDVDHYETATDSYYCVEIEREDYEKKIYLNEQGEEIGRPSVDVDVPSGGGVQVTSGIESFLQENYPDAYVKERDYDDGHIEVEIIHDGREKDVVFNFNEEWLRTTYDVYPNELPDAVKAALKAEFDEHAYWGDDDCECVETPEGTFYEVEVETRGDDWDVYISAAGKIIWMED